MDKPLTIRNAYMFAKVMDDKDLCKGVLESILGIEIDDIVYQSTEEVLQPYLDTRGVRLDAYVKATGQVFDIELQAANKPHLDKRMRYYQSAIDATLIIKGSQFDELDESFVIFICGYDPYGEGLPVYHIDRVCREDPSIEIKDASHWVVLNSRAWAEDNDAARSHLLQFVQDGTASDSLTEGLAKAVKAANDDIEWRKTVAGFMTLEHDFEVRERYAREQGKAEGLAEGEARGEAKGLAEGLAAGEERYSKLIDALLSENRIDDLKRVADDPDYRHLLFEEYSL